VKHDLIFFDHKCPFCIACVNALASFDKYDKFRFAPLQSKWADFYIPDKKNLRTMVLLERGRGAWIRGKGVMRALWLLGGAWKILGWMYILPKVVLDTFYLCIVKVRHFLTGDCELQIPAHKKLQ